MPFSIFYGVPDINSSLAICEIMRLNCTYFLSVKLCDYILTALLYMFRQLMLRSFNCYEHKLISAFPGFRSFFQNALMK